MLLHGNHFLKILAALAQYWLGSGIIHSLYDTHVNVCTQCRVLQLTNIENGKSIIKVIALQIQVLFQTTKPSIADVPLCQSIGTKSTSKVE